MSFNLKLGSKKGPVPRMIHVKTSGDDRLPAYQLLINPFGVCSESVMDLIKIHEFSRCVLSACCKARDKMVNRIDSELITQRGHKTSLHMLQATWGAQPGGEGGNHPCWGS